jgi:outer membrane protein OmpA-like peptidoglycan-associated protein
MVMAALLSLTLGREARWAHLWVRGDASGVMPVTAPTSDYFGLGIGAFVVGLGEIGPFIDLGAEAGYVFASKAAASPLPGPASLVAVGPVARVHSLRPARGFLFWAQGSLNYVRTGSLDRVGLNFGLGVSWLFSPTLALGPRIDYRAIFAMSGADFPTSDAGLITFGVALEFGLFDAKSVAPCPAEPTADWPADCPPLAGDRDGDGVVGSADACPLESGLAAFQGCPDPDPDRDGVVGKADLCPTVPEDPDGFEDTDGCPEPDNDGDGISDANDACPGAKGLASAKGCPDQDGDDIPDRLDKCPGVPGLAAEAGCPRHAHVIVTEKKVELHQKVFFAPTTWTILPGSFALLDEAVQAIRDRGTLCLRIEGRVDAAGTPEQKLKLSQARAEAVLAHLVSRGLPGLSLSAHGSTEKSSEGIELVLVPCARRTP